MLQQIIQHIIYMLPFWGAIVVLFAALNGKFFPWI